MSLATKNSPISTRRPFFFRLLGDRITANLKRRRTIRTLRACRQSDLRDVGIILQDIFELETGSATDAVNTLCRNAGQRAGNW